MQDFLYSIARPLLFCMPPEKAHRVTTTCLRWALSFPCMRCFLRKRYGLEDPRLERDFCGLHFRNPVGLAAGFDKNATLYDAFSALGFSFIEVGTVTPKAQDGNAQPRLFRLVDDHALINRMGFNNLGMEAAIRHLKKDHGGLIIGGNIGKNTLTDNQDAPNDYLKCFQALYEVVDYFSVNVSCPNVKNLRSLQNTESLTAILEPLIAFRAKQSLRKPILLKISPDLSFEQVDETLELISKLHLDGVVATNTTTSREGLSCSQLELECIGNGGLSGKPLYMKSTAIIKYISEKTSGNLPIIGVGGIFSEADALEKIAAGATLVQLYSGFIYEGPALTKRILKAILKNS